MKKSWLKPESGRSGVTRAFLLAAALFTAGSALAAGKVGEMAAGFTGLTGLDGKSYSLNDYHGKVILIMTVQWNCGGCNANAPQVGAIARKFQGEKFQAFGPDINFATKEQLGAFEKNLKKTAADVKFPLLMGLPNNQIKDSIKNNANFGTMWIPYNALRDVFFVIDHTGRIAARIDGNRGGSMGADNYKALEDAIAAAIGKVPTTILDAVSGNNDLCLRACKRAGLFQIDLDPGMAGNSGDVILRILDPQGRLVRILDWNNHSAVGTSGRQALWDGLDARGKAVAWGTYFLNAAAPGSSVTLMLPWIP